MIDTIPMTEATPITMPSVVRKLRKPCAQIELSAERAPSVAANHIGYFAPAKRPPARLLSGLSTVFVCIVFHDPPVPQPGHALAVRGDIRFVRDDDNRLPILVQFIE